MSKRRKLDEYLANAGFQGINLDTIPIELLVNVFSSFSDKDILSLHGLSIDLNKRLRRAAEMVMKLKVQEKLGSFVVQEIETIFNGNVNYRHLLIAIMAYVRMPEFFGSLRFSTPTQSIVFQIAYSERKPIVIYGKTKELLYRLFEYLRFHEIGRSNIRIRRFERSQYMVDLNTDIIFKPQLIGIILPYTILELGPEFYLDNNYGPFGWIDPKARIRCSICDTPATMKCKECVQYFCSEKCNVNSCLI